MLAIDPGERRIGVAVSDERGTIARPLSIIHRSSWERDIEQLAALIREQAPVEIVVGYPVLVSGERGQQARRAERLSHKLRRVTDTPIRMVDERFSSLEASERLRATSGRRRLGAPNDAEAAAVILQRVLDERE
ncbi:MAG: Holliday junction resolvase RuvX [Chloroflexi bacterium]|nr:Holliday junction resolvase RuvX [Chloroflexota bacterium]